MNRKVLVAAVAAAFVAPAAFAQSSVTVGGTINIMWDTIKATGNTGGDVAGGVNNSLRSHDRVRDGAGSNIRFTVIEDLGGGNDCGQVSGASARCILDAPTGSICRLGTNLWPIRKAILRLASRTEFPAAKAAE